MKAVIGRVSYARLYVDNKLVSEIGQGLVVYVGFGADDAESDIAPFCKKLAAMRIFEDERGKLNLSVRDVGGKIMLVSNFTLCGDISHGNRPDFMRAMRPEPAKALFDKCAAELDSLVPTVTGVFGADMTIERADVGPVNILY